MTKKYTEEEMQSNELKRIENEENRIENEENRIENEAERVANEIERIANEENRIENEAERVANEEIRNEFYEGFNDRLDTVDSQLAHIEKNINGVKNIKEYEYLVNNNNWIEAFEQATNDCNEYGYDLFIPSGKYYISRTWYLPPYVNIYGSGQYTKIIANNEMCEKSYLENMSVVSCDNKGQHPYKLSNVYIGSEKDNDLNGLHIGGSRCSEFSHITIQGFGGSGVLVYPTNVDSGDIENFTLRHIWTNKVYEGLTIKTNKNINRGHITDGQVLHCQFTTLDGVYTKNSGHAINIQGDANKYLFGLTFNRCFVHSRLNSLININNEPGSIVYDLHFSSIKGELWGQNKLGDDVSSVHCLEVTKLQHSSFSNCFINENNSKGIYLSNSRYNDFKNFYWNYLVNKTAKYIYLDENCAFNNLNINIDDAYYETRTNYANYPFDLFKDKIIDLGYSNNVYNSAIKNEVKLINDPGKLFDVSGGLLTNYNTLSLGYSATIVNGDLRITFKSGVTDSRILIPVNLKGLKHVGLYLKYKIENNDFDDVIQVGVSGLSKDLKKDNEEHEMCVVFDNTIFDYNYYYIRCKGGQQLKKDVTITIYNFEIYEGFTIPYIPNYICY